MGHITVWLLNVFWWTRSKGLWWTSWDNCGLAELCVRRNDEMLRLRAVRTGLGKLGCLSFMSDWSFIDACLVARALLTIRHPIVDGGLDLAQEVRAEWCCQMSNNVEADVEIPKPP